MNNNTCDALNLSTNGRKMEGASIKSKKTRGNGALVVVNEEEGYDRDYNQQVRIRKIYTICEQSYHYTQRIKPKGVADWLDRETLATRRKHAGSCSYFIS